MSNSDKLKRDTKRRDRMRYLLGQGELPNLYKRYIEECRKTGTVPVSLAMSNFEGWLNINLPRWITGVYERYMAKQGIHLPNKGGK